MILTSVVLTFVTVAAASQIQPPAPAGSDAVRVHTVARPDGKLQIWEISRGRLAPLPRPAAGSLPLTGAQATTIAQSWLSRQIPGIKEWTRVSIALRRFGTDRGGAPAPNGWFYALLLEPANLQPIPPPFASDQRRFWTVVLLDGTVVEPKIVDDPAHDPTVYTIGPGLKRPSDPSSNRGSTPAPSTERR